MSYVALPNGPGCGERSLSDSDECSKAAATLGYRESVQVGSWSWAPYGCVVQVGNNGQLDT